MINHLRHDFRSTLGFLMITLALLHLHCYHPSSDQSFGPVLDDVASEGEPFESELGDLVSFHTASLSCCLRNVVVVKCLLHSLPNVDPRVDNLARSSMELVEAQLQVVCDSPEDNYKIHNFVFLNLKCYCIDEFIK